MIVTLPADVICLAFKFLSNDVDAEGCGTIKCGSTTCRNYDGTCNVCWILVMQINVM